MGHRFIDRRADFESEAIPHLKDLRRTAARLLRGLDEADDAVQETYLLAWKSFHRYRMGTNCKAWLYRILTNVVRQKRRTARKWLTGIEGDIADRELVAPAPVPAAVTDDEMLAALDRLPRPFLDTLMLVDVDDFSYKEASKALNIPIGTVMSRLSRGRAKLKKQLVGLRRKRDYFQHHRRK